MGKCQICGNKGLEVIEICQECLQRAAVNTEDIERLKHISSILQITADTDTNIKECMNGILEIAADLERSGTGGKKKEKKDKTG